MITDVHLYNFKCFKEEKFNFSKLNLLTGINGRGKSSLLQSILLLSQTFRKLKNPHKLLFNGEWVELGSFDDIRNVNLDEKLIKIRIITDDDIENDIVFEFTEFEKNERIAELIGLIINGEDKFVEMSDSSGESESTIDGKSPKKYLSSIEPIKTFSIFQNFHFISADRLGPVEYVKKNNTPEVAQIGIRGENVINVLNTSGEIFSVEKTLCVKNINSNLLSQTIAWLSYILDGGDIKIKGIEKHSSILMMMLGVQSNDKFFKPVNVGFGYSYILPLIITGLISKPGDVVIIENPEAHLHPRAQSRIAEFFSIVASSGVQVFIESHSEHILNGLRVSSLNPDININCDDVVFHYFNESFVSEKLQMNEKGKIANWPLGFFDQQEIDLAEIFKYSIKS